MKEGETIQEMYTRFTTLTNELKSLGRISLEEEKVEKILTRLLPVSWESKITAIQESMNIATLKMDELIGNLTAYELKRQTIKMDAPKNERSLALRIAEGSDLEDDEMTMITRNFKNYLMRGKGSSRDEESEDGARDEQALVAIGESDDEQEVSILHLKDKIKFLSKERLSEQLHDFIDEFEIINNEKEELYRECMILKAMSKNLESRANESESENNEFKNQVLELDTSVLELRSENLKLKLGTGNKKSDHTHLTLEENLGKMKDELYKKDEQIRVLKEDLGEGPSEGKQQNMEKRVNNIYIVDLSTLSENKLTCLSVLDNDPLMWHKRLGHASLNQLNKLHKSKWHQKTEQVMEQVLPSRAT
ncbi:spindle assembly checkpoint component MAD1-like [Nicotiana sylvestris]|uniref:spindle assembly checkpoint component MAD1-like n=1 Tax=Nicotiana sylvestris TaxID=4096 RepID=UPI00388C7F4F